MHPETNYQRMKRYFLFISTLFCAAAFWAQSHDADAAKKVGEGEINRQQEFFDPTRKVNKLKENYSFSVDYRFEVGYAQNQQRSTYVPNPFLHGIKLGATFDFNLPLHFSIQTGLDFVTTYGRIQQHYRSVDLENLQVEYLGHGINQYYLELPIRLYYNQKLWRDLNLFFYTGPAFDFGLAQLDFVHDHLSDPTRAWLEKQQVPIADYNRYDNELYRVNVRYGLGGGLEWGPYRLVAGYDFGLNNLLKQRLVSGAKMNEWGWHVSFAYRINKK